MNAPIPIRTQIEAVLDVAGPRDLALQAAAKTLSLFERFEPEAREFFAECIRKDAEKRRAAEHPVVRTVLDAFPDAEIG